MKIYILKVPSKLQPAKKITKYPKHNKDYGVEQDFLKYLTKHQKLITDDPSKAKWHYLPIYWTRWHVNHNYGNNGTEELQKIVNNTIIESKKTFTICQYDDGPVVNLYSTKLFLASRKSYHGIDIPLLCSEHKIPFIIPKKRYLASFMGRISTHVCRKSMYDLLCDDPKYRVYDGDFETNKFTKEIISSYVALCPRGYGGSSFRFYEAMQLGVVPLHIGDLDVRPFKKWINWGKCSIYVKDANQIKKTLDTYDQIRLLEMGRQAKIIYHSEIKYGKLGKYIIKVLNE